jgi:Na+/H+ antiporter NhaD/arsenite permease-like protein
MELTIVCIFIVGYILIALEHPISINKTATALITGVLCWTLYALSDSATYSLTAENFKEHIIEQLGEHLNEIAQILFFLMGAMTIVELIDAHKGFAFITEKIHTQNPKKLLWIVSWLTFFLSAILDNLTTTIVMISLIRKLIPAKDMRLFFAGMIILAANAGGAWSPIGDVTTTMLWIGGQISALAVIKSLIIPSIVCTLVPLIYLTFSMKGTLGKFTGENREVSKLNTGRIMFLVGLGCLVSVPVFKTVTHLPPFLGMMLALGVMWVVSEIVNPDVDENLRKHYTAGHALAKIDMPSVLFFLGILLAVTALQSMGTLSRFAAYLNSTLGDQRIIITLIGILSSIVDNVPLVAASIGMYSLDAFPTDDFIWEYLAYCAGTGGSILVIGSAAGVAAMGMEKIDFIWYLRKISLLALLGYASGAICFLLLTSMS